LTSHVLVPPAMTALLSSPNNKVQAYLAAGHVCAVMGYKEYSPIAEKYKVPIVVTGFEPIDILDGILATVKQLENGKSFVENKYPRVVTKNGNTQAQTIIEQVFEISDRKWRGIGTIPLSGLKLKNEYRDFDAELYFKTGELIVEEPKECISGIILQGLKKPSECPAFGKTCTPQNPLGATMVSSEGACAAYYSYQRHKVK
ncbi:MAG: hydrogenase formation protein HypD, partial [Bacteroidota bacterium]|nr:hydrogenase formation protein HypD [Bacteroidota bacterium]